MDIARSSLKLFSVDLTNAAIQFLGIIYFARLLGAASIGVFFLFEALLGMFTILANFGIRGGLEKRISEGEDQGSYLTSAIILKTAPLLITVSCVLLFRAILNEYLGENLALFLILAIILQEAARLSLFVLKGELRVGDTATLKLIKQMVWVGTSIIFVTIGLGVKGLVFGLLIGLSVMLILGWYKVSTHPSSPSKKHAYSLFQYSKYNFFTNAGGYFYSWVDVAIIGFFLTQTHVGAYEAAWRITAVVILLSKSISTAMFPQMSRWDTNDSSSQIESTIREAIAPSLLIVIPSFFGVLLFSSQMLRFVFGSEFEIAWLALIVLMGEKIIQSVHMILGRSLQAIDRPNLAARAGVVAIVINLVLNLLLIPKFGIVGAALATTISFTCNSALHAYYLSQFITIELPHIRIAGIVGASIGMSVILRISQSIVGVNNLAQLITVILLGIISFTVFSLSVPSLREMLIGHFYRLVS